MGSSTRRIQTKIKKILTTEVNTDESIDLDVAIPVVAIETLRMKRAKKYFGDKDFLNLLQGGIACVQAFNSGTYREYYGINEEFEDIKKEEKLTIQKVLDAILDKIEEVNEVESSLTLRAFKLAMAELLLDKIMEAGKFMSVFCGYLLFLVIMDNINEAISDIYKDKSTHEYDSLVKNFSFKWVNNNLTGDITKYLNNEIPINDLIEKLFNVSSYSKGDF